MYLNFFDLKKEPFNITPDPEMLFLSPSHKEALAAAIYGVTQRKGFIAIVGEVGVGKTTIVRSFLEKMSGQDLKVIYLFNAVISFPALLKTIYESLGVEAPQSDDVFETVSRLHRILIDLYSRGTNLVVIIDEAQNLPLDTLKSLHMLSNLETSTVKLIQVVLTGQPELEEKLANDLLRQIRQRVVIKVRILPLSKKDSFAYIEHRLAKAKGNPELFSHRALQLIVSAARGVPRIINTLCDNCLITAYGRQQERVTARIATEAVFDVVGKAAFPLKWRHGFAAAGVVACAGIVIALGQGRTIQRSTAVQGPTVQVPAVPVPPLPAPTVPEVTPSHPAKETAVKARLLEEPHPAAPVAAPAAAPAAEQQNGGGRKVVKRGDTLARLIMQRYGYVNRRLMKMVKRSNPQIADENLIQEGSVVYFPPMEEGS
ncbi:AAA family ATPase [Geomonas sp. RF6]|uniref:AAA family ATPase n=1 Tax=Geomonas sp. RF6 TaxID=2897342 RepID=UPI001E5C170D|nr:AAA family ATPase [Geomonas sp. RF6]UFS71093.1 AAA family ATPase [Geomonas sp. RF6]